MRSQFACPSQGSLFTLSLSQRLTSVPRSLVGYPAFCHIPKWANKAQNRVGSSFFAASHVAVSAALSTLGLDGDGPKRSQSGRVREEIGLGSKATAELSMATSNVSTLSYYPRPATARAYAYPIHRKSLIGQLFVPGEICPISILSRNLASTT